MANNKVIDKEGNVLLDLTGDDVVETDVMSGKKFHGRDGVQKTGSLTLVEKTITENGQYLPSNDNASGYSKVTVNVQDQTNPLVTMWNSFKQQSPTNWIRAFFAALNATVITVFSCMTDNMLSVLDFSSSSSVTNTSYMFYGCLSLTTVPLFDTHNVTTMDGMFVACKSLLSVPVFDTSNVTSMQSMFDGCSLLTSVPAFDTSNVTGNQSMQSMFDNCSSLTEIHMTGMKVSFNISASTLFTESALVEILNNLATVSSTKTLTMGSTNLAKLTAAEKAIATNKGWTLA